MSDFVGPILEVIEFVGRPAKKYLNYHRKFEDYKAGFKRAREDLEAREGDIRRQLHDEHRFGKKPKLEVERWFKKVEEKFGHARDVEDKVSTGNYLFRSCIGKLLDEETQAMKEVHAEGHFSGSLVVDDPSAATAMPVPELEGGYGAKEEIDKFLVGDEVRMIGVWGMGGIGKTTIMKHVYNRLLEENKFSKLIWTTVSQNFDIRTLQESIANQLKEKLSGVDLAIRAATVSGMLRRQGRYVLILDDVWSRFSLEEVGIPKPTTDNGCKLVLTTRSKEVVRSMDCAEVRVSCLRGDEALQLFLNKVGQDMSPNPTLKSIVEECDGLPLAIVTVASCMKGISDPVVWENALMELRGHIRTIQDVEKKVFACLKFSYDRLQPIDQDCFLYCALYPEDHEIPKEQIIENWMDEGLVEEMGTRKATQSNGHSILKKLEENCLLERVGDEGTYIKMHDVVRDMALDITRKRFLVKAGNEKLPSEEEWTEDLEKISLMGNCISTIPPEVKFPKCEKLTSVLLSNNELENIPESFFNHMPNLKILDLSGGNRGITILPESISNLEKLTALSFRGCLNLHYVPSLLKLQALKKLDLRDTLINQIPRGLEMLVNLTYLNLGDTENLEEIPNGLLSKLCHLQYLVIRPASTRAEEMRELNKLEVFEGCFSNVRDIIEFAGQRKKLHRYKIWVGKVDQYWPDIGSRDYSKWVRLVEIDMNIIGDEIMLPCDIQQFFLKKCKGVRSLNDISGWEDLTDLKKCLVWESDEVESIFPSKCCQLETLEYLDLRFLDNLKGIVGVSSVATFSSLKIIRLVDCETIKNLFSAKWVMPNLEEIYVSNCEEMEEIIVSEEAETIKFQYILPKLRDLVLKHLPKLKNICNENGVMVCDSLQMLGIRRCGKLKRIPLYLDPDKEEPSLPPLKRILVDPEEWWESVEFDHPLAKNVLQPILYFYDRNTRRWKPAV